MRVSRIDGTERQTSARVSLVGRADAGQGNVAPQSRSLTFAGNGIVIRTRPFCLARLGQRDETRAILNQMLERAKTRYVPPVSLAVLHAALGENASALDALERAFEGHDTQLIFLKNDPRWSGLRQEPRFAVLMQKLKLDRYGPGLMPS